MVGRGGEIGGNFLKSSLDCFSGHSARKRRMEGLIHMGRKEGGTASSRKMFSPSLGQTAKREIVE